MGGVAVVTRRLAVWVPLFVLAGILGRLTIIDGGALSLVWPAAGIALLWVGSARRQTAAVDVTVLAGCVFSVNLVTGAPAPLAAVFVVSALTQVGLIVLALRRWCGHLYLFGGTAPVATLRDLGFYVATAVSSAAVGAVVGVVGLLLVGPVPATWTSLLVWWGRNSAGVVVVGLLGLMLLHRAAVATGAVAAPRALVVRRSRLELALLWTGSVGLLWLVFGSTQVLPLSFLLLFTTVLVAVRLGPLAVTTHGLVVGAVAVVGTLLGRGPFASIAEVSERALVAQVFVVMTVLTGLVLTFSRSERDAATAELRELERESAERARLFGSVLEHMKEGVNVVAADGRLVVSNRAGDRLLGRSVDEVVDPTTVTEAYGLRHVDGSEVAPAHVPYVRAAAGETFTQDYQLARPGEHPFVLEITAGPLPTEPDEVPQAVITFRDVTALRHDRDALATFAGVVAHDLKRPLTVITGWTDALTDDLAAGTLDREAGLMMLGRVAGASEQMGRLLDDLLHYTVVRDAKVRLEPVDVSDLAEQVAEDLRCSGSAPRIVVAPGLRVRADRVLLRQVLDNLLGNAVKYVAPGVRPHVVVAGRHEGTHVVVTVSDNGIGVPETQRERVFDTFHRAHGDDYRGTGLGLAIVRRAVERCEGTVRLLPAPDGGSCFEVRLPAVVLEPVDDLPALKTG